MNLRLSMGGLFIAMAIAVVGCVGHPGSHLAGAGLPLKAHNLPPAERLLEPGPGVGGPGPGVMPPALPPPIEFLHGPPPTVQVMFARPESMQVRWDVGGAGQFDSTPLVVPGRYNFPQGAIYRLKLTNISGREGVELYPTVEIGPATPRTGAYLAHNAIPVQFTEEDFDQVLSGNFVTKVIYLPDPEFQDLALAGVETLVSTRLDPGVDPIVEADRRGAIMAIIRMGNKDIEMPDGLGDGGSVIPASHNVGFGGGPVPMGGGPVHMGGGPVPMGPMPVTDGGASPPYISGVTSPDWGMPMSGTPIGLPGPPHIPLGTPAGLQKHVIRNHTQMHIPGPTEKMSIHVQQKPGFSYPKPAEHMFIQEQLYHPALNYHQPAGNKYQYLPSPGGYGHPGAQGH